MVRRRRLALLDERLVRTAFTRCERRQRLLFVLRIALLILAATPLKLCPAQADHAHAPGAKRLAVGRAIDRGDLFQTRGIESRNQPRDNGIEHALLGRRKTLRQVAGGDDRVVVADLSIIDDAAGERQRVQIQPVDFLRSVRLQLPQDPGDLRFHVARQVSRVGSRIGDQLGLVQRLGCFEGGIRRKSEAAVHVPLQFGQIVELRRLAPFLLAIDLGDRERMALDVL